jgi:hypothetical protein
MRRSFACAIAIAVLPVVAQAEPTFLSGAVGGAAVFMELDGSEGPIAGWYLYLKYGKEIRVHGQISANGSFTLNEYGDSATPTAVFTGTVRGLSWTGTWRKTSGAAPVPVALSVNHDTLATLNAHFACDPVTRDTRFGWRSDESLAFDVVRGRVRRLDVAHSARSDAGDEQNCGIGLDQLNRTASRAGVRFRAKDDDLTLEGSHCTVHVIGAGDYLYLEIGDFTEDGDDCMGLDDSVRFCSPRGSWSDLILDRRTGTCRFVQ